MEAFASTSDESLMMKMFEELMAKAIDKREANNLSPDFPAIIKSLSPMQALLISRLLEGEHFSDQLMDQTQSQIKHYVDSNFDAGEFGGMNQHLTLCQSLEHKTLIAILAFPTPKNLYPDVEVPAGLTLRRMVFRLSMFGHWFASTCAVKAPNSGSQATRVDSTAP